MANTVSRNAEEGRDDTATRKALADADRAFTFGPSFFLLHLGRFVRDRCPDPEEHLPLVQLHLADGETLNVCHTIGVSPRWVMLAVADASGHREGMAIECLPFPLIHHVSIAARRADCTSVGFRQAQAPSIIPAETLLHSAMSTQYGVS